MASIFDVFRIQSAESPPWKSTISWIPLGLIKFEQGPLVSWKKKLKCYSIENACQQQLQAQLSRKRSLAGKTLTPHFLFIFERRISPSHPPPPPPRGLPMNTGGTGQSAAREIHAFRSRRMLPGQLNKSSSSDGSLSISGTREP